jgi:ABC-type transporter Mla subunit MlaD
MTSRASYFRIGLFVLGAIAIAVVFVVAFGAGRWLRPKMVMETYFNESVQGIDVGSAIKYRGVTIGQIGRIGFTYTEYEQDKPPEKRRQYVMVEGIIQPEQVSGGARAIDPQIIEALVGRGLRVQMAAQGLTGTYYLELDYVDPKRNPPLPIDWTPEQLYIPSARSTVGQLVSGAEALMRKLDRANLDELVVNLNGMIADVTRTLQKLDTEKLSDNTNGLVAELRQTNRQLQQLLADPGWAAIPDEIGRTLAATRKAVGSFDGEEITQTVVRLRQSLDGVDRAVARLDHALTAPETDLPVILDDLRHTTESLRALSDQLRRNPAALVFGQPPKPLERPAAPRQ